MIFSNLPFIPDFYEGELFISHYSRFVSLAARNDLRELISVLNGSERDRPKKELLSLYLQQLLKNKIRLPELFYKNSIESLNFAIGRGFSKDYMTKALLNTLPRYRYCAVCSRQDMELYGDTYLRRHHQVPIVLVCDIHCCELRETSRASMSRCELILPPLLSDEPRHDPGAVSDLLLNVAKGIRLAFDIPYPLPGGHHILQRYLTSVMVYQATRAHGLDKESSVEIENRLREERAKISLFIGVVRSKASTASFEIIRSVRREVSGNLDEMLLVASALGVSEQCLKILSNERLQDSERWVKNVSQPSELKVTRGGKFDLIIPFSQRGSEEFFEQYLSVSEADHRIVGIEDRAPNARGTRVYGVPIDLAKSFVVLSFGSRRASVWQGQTRQESI